MKHRSIKKTTDDHSHQWLDENGWSIRTAYLEGTDGNIYEATLNIADGRDRRILYEINKVHKIDKRKTSGEHTDTDNNQRSRYQEPEPGRTQSEDDGISIIDSNESVNTKYSITTEDVEKNALDHFGKTYRWSETGYILKNGSKLDFSGRNDGAPGGYRTVDHREIVDIYPEDTNLDGNEAMVDFMSRGNIRIMPEGNGINLQTMPTKAQLQSLDDFIFKARGEVYLDIDDENGNTVVSAEYNRGTRAAKVLQDIKNWFEKGEKPKISELSAFYSVSSEDKAQQTAERDLAKGIGEIMQRPRRLESGNYLPKAVLENFFGLLKSDLLYLQNFSP